MQMAHRGVQRTTTPRLSWTRSRANRTGVRGQPASRAQKGRNKVWTSLLIMPSRGHGELCPRSCQLSSKSECCACSAASIAGSPFSLRDVKMCIVCFLGVTQKAYNHVFFPTPRSLVPDAACLCYLASGSHLVPRRVSGVGFVLLTACVNRDAFR